MFTVEIKINGTMIVHIYGLNKCEITDTGETKYDYEIYEVSTRQVKSGSINHFRSKGVAPLVASILLDSEKEKENEVLLGLRK